MEEEARRQAAAAAEAERQRRENERKQAEDLAAWQRQQLLYGNAFSWFTFF